MKNNYSKKVWAENLASPRYIIGYWSSFLTAFSDNCGCVILPLENPSVCS
jgi:hypothetical protein